MSNRDWSLVCFTTLAQWSIGIVLWFTLNTFLSVNPATGFETGLDLKNPVLLSLFLIGGATLVSFLHLGKPANALKALSNLSGSWLSREILAIGVFSVSLAIVLLTGWNNGESGYQDYLLVISSCCGLVLLWMMIRIYIMPTIPAWNSWYTPLNFISTTLNLGLVTVLVFHAAGWVKIDSQVFNWFMVFLMLILFVETISGILHQYRLQRLKTGIDALVFDRGSFYGVFIFRLMLLLIAFLAVFNVILNSSVVSGYQYHLWLYPILALIIIQELAGRLLFYSSYFRVGV